mgnify:CR=1 FL=1
MAVPSTASREVPHEVIPCDQLLALGGFAEARKQGRLRLESKEYEVEDGDVLT